MDKAQANANAWSVSVLLGNGWLSTITNVTMTHTVYNPNTNKNQTTTFGPFPSMSADAVSAVAQVTTYAGQSDTWTLDFTDGAGGNHSAKMTADIESDDEGAIVFAQVTKENKRWTLYFPVSSDSHTDI